jgi:uncharacterized iron-regulated protein
VQLAGLFDRLTRARGLAAAACVLLVSATPGLLGAGHCAAAEPVQQSWSEWTVATGTEHPLAGSITDGSGRRVVLERAADGTPKLPAADLLLLGEVHDNPHHHLLRAWLLGTLAVGGPNLAVVFEHIRTDQQDTVDGLISAKPAPSAADLLAGLDWNNSGWPGAEMFHPLFAKAIGLGLPIVAGNLPRAQIRNVARNGMTALDASEVRRLGLDQGLEPALHSALIDELDGSHCGLIPRNAMEGLATAQRLRDAHLAAAMIEAGRRRGRAVLLAGNGHVRTDRGVPWHLRRLAAGSKVLAVMLIETVPGRLDAAGYLPKDPHGGPAVDLVIFTPAVKREDPCEAMRRSFRK